MSDRETISAIITRPGESTVAVVSCQKFHTVQTVEDMQKAVIKAVTEWVKTDPGGRTAWEQSERDFNIGDLALYVGWECDKDLRRLLVQNCLVGFQVEATETDTPVDWVFDTILVDVAELEK